MLCVKVACPVGPLSLVGSAPLGPGVSKPISLVFGRMISLILDSRIDISPTTYAGFPQERRLSLGKRQVRHFGPSLKEPQDEISLGLTRGQKALSGLFRR